MLEVIGLAFRYEAMRMLFNLTVAAGECTAVIGPSGAGKSTLLGLIAGFERSIGGCVRIDGHDITTLAPAARPVSMVFQEHNLFPHLDVAANVGLGVHPGLKLTRTDRGRVDEALVQVGLAEYGKRLPAQLSGGQRQRVALARALVRQRPVLLLDEPFAALGPALRTEMLALVDGLRRAAGLTVLLVSHHPGDAHRIASRTAFVHHGRLLAEAATGELFNCPMPELRAYLGALDGR